MEDIKEKNIIIIKKIGIILIITLVLILISTLILPILIKENNKKFEKFINNNYSTDSNDDIFYTPLKRNSILTKVTKIDGDKYIKIAIDYKNKNNIDGTLEAHGKNKYGIEGVSYIKSTYKNKKFECNIISNKGYTVRCDLLKKHTLNFEKEMKKILKKAKTNELLLKPKKTD